MLYKVVLTIQMKLLAKGYWAVRLCGTICYALQDGSNLFI